MKQAFFGKPGNKQINGQINSLIIGMAATSVAAVLHTEPKHKRRLNQKPPPYRHGKTTAATRLFFVGRRAVIRIYQ